MKKITKHEIKKQFKTTQPVLIDIIGVLFGLIFEIGMPAAALVLGISVISIDALMGIIILLVVFPIVLGIGLFLFHGVLISTIKKRLSMRSRKNKIVLAKCTGVKPLAIDTESGEATLFQYTFKTSDGIINSTDNGVPKGQEAYLVILGKTVVAVFDAQKYYTDNYSTSLVDSKKPRKAQKHSFDNFKKVSKKVFGYVFLEFLLLGVIAIDVAGIIYKEWILSLGSGLLLIFYLLGSVLGEIHAKATGIITIIYLFVNGILFYYLSYTYSHSTAAYIVGTAYVLVSLIISVIWINVKSKNKK